MQELQQNNSWRSSLPKSYAWLEALEILSVDKPQPGIHHIVPVLGDENASFGFEILANGFDSTLKDKIKKAASIEGWQGKGDPISLTIDETPYILVRVTKLEVEPSQKSRQIGLDAYKSIKDRTIKGLVITESDELNALDIFEGLASAAYDCHAFKETKEGEAEVNLPKKLNILSDKYSEKVIAQHVAMAKAATFTRLLQDAPPNFLDSEMFAKFAELISAEFKLKCEILGREELRKKGMGSFLSVAVGTQIDPKLITIEIPGVDTSKTVALVGKGLTFDSGGISLKPGAGMHEMKYDMSGGAAVLGAALFFSMVKPPVNVICSIGAVENMPGNCATRPGDIVRAMNGKTIEILNTDAEGRLVLADVLHYVCDKFKPNLTIDIATLTGAVLMGLGTVGSALMTNDKKTSEYMLHMSKKAGEPFWELPLWPELSKEIKSEVADLKNIANPNVKAGTIVAGVFLKEFVTGNWAHLDIAGTGWSCKTTGYPDQGGSAFGLRIMTEACLNFEN